jgi:hypothetical protein
VAVTDDEEVAKPTGKNTLTHEPAGPTTTPSKKSSSRPDAEKEMWDTGVSEVGE